VTLQYDPALDEERQVRMAATQAPLIHTGEVEIGWMEGSVWREMYRILLDGGVLAQPIDVSEVYSLEFLDKIYGER